MKLKIQANRCLTGLACFGVPEEHINKLHEHKIHGLKKFHDQDDIIMISRVNNLEKILLHSGVLAKQST